MAFNPEFDNGVKPKNLYLGLVSEKEGSIADLTNKVSELEAKLAKSEATETVVEADSDPVIVTEEVVVNEWDSFAKSILK